MNANKMPDRIYLLDYNDAMVTPLEGDTVYVRADAFIEKSVNWLRCHPSSHYDDLEEFANAFKKAMEL